jgi:Ser/Thr protein kinase RdoA (MazF antagonist)
MEAELSGLLRRHYGVAVGAVRRIRAGSATHNFRVESDAGTLFVKRYAAGTDLARPRSAIGLTRLAGRRGVPVARIRYGLEGQVLSEEPGGALTVWDWAPGTAREHGLNPAEAAEAGTALGRVHRAFAPLPGYFPDLAARWLELDPAAVAGRVDRLLATVEERRRAGSSDPFDAVAERTLTERREQVGRLEAVRRGLPALTRQILHGDYAPPNLLYQEGRLLAVLDFGPAATYLPAWEQGRIAFDPRTVAGEGWLESARALVEAYLAEEPEVSPGDVAGCCRVALIQLLRSLFGVREHYLGTALLPDDLDRFWVARQRAAGILLEHLDEAEAMLAELQGS